MYAGCAWHVACGRHVQVVLCACVCGVLYMWEGGVCTWVLYMHVEHRVHMAHVVCVHVQYVHV